MMMKKKINKQYSLCVTSKPSLASRRDVIRTLSIESSTTRIVFVAVGACLTRSELGTMDDMEPTARRSSAKPRLRTAELVLLLEHSSIGNYN